MVNNLVVSRLNGNRAEAAGDIVDLTVVRVSDALVRYFQAALKRKGGKCVRISDTEFQVQQDGAPPFRITTDRATAKEDEQTSLLGLDHPFVKELLDEDRQLEGSARALAASRPEDSKEGSYRVACFSSRRKSALYAESHPDRIRQ